MTVTVNSVMVILVQHAKVILEFGTEEVQDKVKLLELTEFKTKMSDNIHK